MYPRLQGLRLQVPAAFPSVITGRFGDPRNYSFAPNKLQAHEGIDFAPAQRGWPSLAVVPVMAGLVVKAGFDARGYGNYLIMRHVHLNEVLFGWYAHFQTMYVSAGDYLPNLWVLGEAGDTGYASGRHLHFTLQWPGHGLKGYVVDDVIDPMPYFVEGYEA